MTISPSWIWRYRRLSWFARSLPDFLVIGAQKAGTSSLYSYLVQHPEILPPYTKEAHYFDGGLRPMIDNYKKGSAYYRAYFPIKKSSDQSKTFEATPAYIFNPLVPKRIFDLVPQVKIIVLLRNPTDRAISQYFHEKRKGNETLPLIDALQAEEGRLAESIRQADYKSHSFIHHSYKSRGLYKQQLDRLFEYFPRSQVLILGSEEFSRQPQEIATQVFDFIEVDRGFVVKDLKPQNVSSNRTDVDSSVYAYLDDFFRPHNIDLYQMTGRDYGWNNPR